MSEEELRKIAKEEASKFIMENLNSVIIFTYIQNLEKEIEELKKDNNHQWEERCRLTFDIEKNFISKDKIREKIKEYDKIRLETKDSDLYDEMQDYIDVLIELLKEE